MTDYTFKNELGISMAVTFKDLKCRSRDKGDPKKDMMEYIGVKVDIRSLEKNYEMTLTYKEMAGIHRAFGGFMRENGRKSELQIIKSK